MGRNSTGRNASLRKSEGCRTDNLPAPEFSIRVLLSFPVASQHVLDLPDTDAEFLPDFSTFHSFFPEREDIGKEAAGRDSAVGFVFE
jgi:hypothetical protein